MKNRPNVGLVVVETWLGSFEPLRAITLVDCNIAAPYAGIIRIRFTGVDGRLAVLSARFPELPRHLLLVTTVWPKFRLNSHSRWSSYLCWREYFASIVTRIRSTLGVEQCDQSFWFRSFTRRIPSRKQDSYGEHVSSRDGDDEELGYDERREVILGIVEWIGTFHRHQVIWRRSSSLYQSLLLSSMQHTWLSMRSFRLAVRLALPLHVQLWMFPLSKLRLFRPLHRTIRFWRVGWGMVRSGFWVLERWFQVWVWLRLL